MPIPIVSTLSGSFLSQKAMVNHTLIVHSDSEDGA